MRKARSGIERGSRWTPSFLPHREKSRPRSRQRFVPNSLISVALAELCARSSFEVSLHQGQNGFGLVVLGQQAQSVGEGAIALVKIGHPSRPLYDDAHISHSGQLAQRFQLVLGRRDER